MKKILFAVFALAALASCTNNEVIELNQQAIAFGDVFVDNATRADYSGGKDIQSFKVYGTVDGENIVQIFNGATVERPDGLNSGYNDTKAWDCDVIQYWVPSAEYQFAAIVDATDIACNATTPLLPETINFTVTDGDGDLLYAVAEAETDENATPDVSMVAFTFNHLLSKVGFTVTDNMGDYDVNVTGITVTGVQKSGIYTIGGTNGIGGSWAKDGDATVNLDFSNGATRQIIPVQQTLNITIAYDIMFDGAKISSYTKAKDLTHTFAMNTAYNIDVTIGATAIQFTVTEVNGFGAPVAPDSDPSITIQ